MAILKIKDKGVWKEIQAIKGDTGHDVYVGDKSKTPSEAKLIIEPVKGTATGTDIQITDSVNDRVSKLVLDGKSTQETRSGKNLFNQNLFTTKTTNGITITPQNDGGIKVSGKNSLTSETNFALGDWSSTIPIINLDTSKNYTLSIKGNIQNVVGFNIRGIKNNSINKIVYSSENVSSINISGFSAINYISIVVYGSKTPNTTLYLQVEQNSTATEFEKYGVRPSPDYPSEIENVKGKNLLGLTDGTRTHNGITAIVSNGEISLSGTATAISFIYLITNTLNLSAGTYTLSANNPNLYNDKQFDLRITGKDGVVIKGRTFLNVANSSTTITLSEDVVNGCLQVRASSGDVLSNFTLKPMLEKGSIATRYVPYGNIQIVETGKNLFDIEGRYETGTGITYTKNDDGSYTLNGTASGNNFLRGVCYLNEQHTISYSSSASNNNVFIRTRTGTPSAQTGIKDQLVISSTSGSLTSSKQFDFVEISIASGTTLNNFKIYIQLEKGSIATSYEPYTEEVVNIDLKGNELCSLPNGTKDELIVKDGRAKIVKRIGKVILDGSDDETWLFADNNRTFRTTSNYIPKLSNIKINKVETSNNLTHALSNYYTVSTQNGVKPGSNKMGFSQWRSTKFLYLPADYNTVDKVKTWLSTHNVTVQYELETPEEIDLGEISTLTTYEGVSNITNSEDTNMSIEYDTNKTNLYYQNNGNIIKMNKGS